MAQPGNVGSKPTFSVVPNSKRHKALTRLRRWFKHRRQWREQRVRCASGRVYAERIAVGRARPFELGMVRAALLDVLSPRAVELVCHAYAMQRGFGGRDGFVASYVILARVMRCSKRTAQTVVAELVDLGLLEVRPEFTELLADVEAGRDDVVCEARRRGAKKHRELVPAYRTTARLDLAISRATERIRARGSSQGGKSCHPTEIQPPLRGVKKGVRGRGRPEQCLRQEIQDARRPPEVLTVARVYERAPDGTRTFCNTPGREPLADARHQATELAQRLGADHSLAAAIGGAWSAFDQRKEPTP